MIPSEKVLAIKRYRMEKPRPLATAGVSQKKPGGSCRPAGGRNDTRSTVSDLSLEGDAEPIGGIFYDLFTVREYCFLVKATELRQ